MQFTSITHIALVLVVSLTSVLASPVADANEARQIKPPPSSSSYFGDYCHTSQNSIALEHHTLPMSLNTGPTPVPYTHIKAASSTSSSSSSTSTVKNITITSTDPEFIYTQNQSSLQAPKPADGGNIWGSRRLQGREWKDSPPV
ncbi:hypothetical protein CVT24_012458 [Panaeolus cyanescens]|uniref:Uncharacterized protein n=1 Tax=Panaeolus cyanescens TaxID=181874 RepID=A0A409WE25_9AGAR|nr:hypothetical protein CVT24_012458 [Panaeolus cyanescens]